MTTAVDTPRINAFIVGVMKSGTTSLARRLEMHPDICLCDTKEAHIFDKARWQETAITNEEVAAKFQRFSGEKIVLDATPIYVFAPGALEALLRYNPDARLILILRNPVDRTISHYGHTVSSGGERRSLALALLLEPWRLRRERRRTQLGQVFRNRSYLSRSFYYRQVAHLLSLSGNVLVLNFADVVGDFPTTLTRICNFLDIPDVGVPLTLPRLHSRALKKPFRVERALLRALFYRDARKTERLLNWPRHTLMPS